MDSLTGITLRRPASAEEAAQLLASPGARALAGGTDLIVNLRHGLEKPALLVDLAGVPGMTELRWDGSALELGAGVTLSRLISDGVVRSNFPVLAQAAEAVAAPGHRSAATVGGNLCLDTRCVYYNQSEGWRRSNGYCLKRNGETCHVAPQGDRCHAAFSGDLAPALIVLRAEVELVSRSSARRLPLERLYRDDGARHLLLEPGELLTAVHVPGQGSTARAAYRKVRSRGAIDFPLAGVAVSLSLEKALLRTLRVALTGTNSHPLLLEGTDALLGQEVSEALLAQIGKLVQKQVSPVRTTLTAPNYRRQVAAAVTQRLVRELAARP
jgi:4-hydroxybenzoyl-CoA reductase subunit beta